MCRGLAIVLMVVFHIAFDLDHFRLYSFRLDSFFWHYLARLAASIFILLVGLSLAISHSKASRSGVERGFFKRIIIRGLKIFCLGLLITFVTFLFIGPGFIVFGILHFIGIAIILSYPFLRLGVLNMITAFFIIVAGLYFQAKTVNFPWLLWLGLTPHDFYTLDFFPLIPWFSLVLIGICLGNLLYDGNKRRFNLPDWSGLLPVKVLRVLGKNSLPIYLLHQPMIIAFLFLLLSQSTFF